MIRTFVKVGGAREPSLPPPGACRRSRSSAKTKAATERGERSLPDEGTLPTPEDAPRRAQLQPSLRLCFPKMYWSSLDKTRGAGVTGAGGGVVRDAGVGGRKGSWSEVATRGSVPVPVLKKGVRRPWGARATRRRAAPEMRRLFGEALAWVAGGRSLQKVNE